jgi:hypothetical protein
MTIWIGHCEACEAMNAHSQFAASYEGSQPKLWLPRACMIVHPALVPPTWQYQIRESRDKGQTWTQVWRGWGNGGLTSEPDHVWAGVGQPGGEAKWQS